MVIKALLINFLRIFRLIIFGIEVRWEEMGKIILAQIEVRKVLNIIFFNFKLYYREFVNIWKNSWGKWGK